MVSIVKSSPQSLGKMQAENESAQQADKESNVGDGCGCENLATNVLRELIYKKRQGMIPTPTIPLHNKGNITNDGHRNYIASMQKLEKEGYLNVQFENNDKTSFQITPASKIMQLLIYKQNESPSIPLGNIEVLQIVGAKQEGQFACTVKYTWKFTPNEIGKILDYENSPFLKGVQSTMFMCTDIPPPASGMGQSAPARPAPQASNKPSSPPPVDTEADKRQQRAERSITSIGELVAQGKYAEADGKLNALYKEFPDWNKIVSNAYLTQMGGYHSTIDRQMNRDKSSGNPLLEGIVTRKSEQAGSGAFWDFELQTSDGAKYPFSCSAAEPPQFQLEGKIINQHEGYEKLKNKYQDVKVYIKADTYDYFVAKCKNEICDEICPTVINMMATSSTATPARQQPPPERTVQEANTRVNSPMNSIPGRFPEASKRLLTPGDLSRLSKADLGIMRTEIFARHGYKFNTVAMKEYFARQPWYTPTSSNVDSLLTALERSNIQLIKKFE
jgi:hypothetical protein